MKLSNKQKKGIQVYLSIFLLNLFFLIIYFSFNDKLELVNFIRDVSTILLLFSLVKIIGYTIEDHYHKHHIKKIPYDDINNISKI